MQIALYYGVQEELQLSIEKSLAMLKEEGHIDA